MQDTIDQINAFLGTNAHIAVENNNLKITTGNEALIIGFVPTIIGGDSMGADPIGTNAKD